MNQPNKTRNLSIFEFLDVLQRELVCCEIRSKTDTHEGQRIYWEEIGEKKKEKIKEICRKHYLPNMLADKNIKKVVESSIYGDFGFPKFIYKDEEQKSQIYKWDVLNYYSKGTKVIIKINDSLQEAEVVKVEFLGPPAIIVILSDGIEHQLDCSNVTRKF